MISMMQAVVQNILNNWGLTDYVSGTVRSVEPLQVQIHDHLVLGQEHLVIADGSFGYQLCENPGAGGALCLQTAADPSGDHLLLLRVSEGQKYLVLARVVT